MQSTYVMIHKLKITTLASMEESIGSMFHLRDTFVITGSLSCKGNFFPTRIKMWQPDLEGQSRAPGKGQSPHHVTTDVSNSSGIYACVHTKLEIGTGGRCDYLRMYVVTVFALSNLCFLLIPWPLALYIRECLQKSFSLHCF